MWPLKLWSEDDENILWLSNDKSLQINEKILSSATSFLVAYQLLSASRILGIASGRLLQKTEMFMTLQIRY